MSLFAVFGLGAVLSAVVLMGAGALMDDAASSAHAAHTADEAADDAAPSPLRVLMAPGGTAVALPEFVTAPDGEVRARWSDADGVRSERRAA